VDPERVARTRQKILDIFGVTEQDIAALDPEGSYAAAREEAERQRAEYLSWAERTRAQVEAELQRLLSERTGPEGWGSRSGR
jgi:hypothetical protein